MKFKDIVPGDLWVVNIKECNNAFLIIATKYELEYERLCRCRLTFFFLWDRDNRKFPSITSYCYNPDATLYNDMTLIRNGVMIHRAVR